MQTSLLLRVLLLAVSSIMIYRYRFRVVNIILGQPWLRSMAVSTFMRLPYVRNRMVGQLFR